MPSKTLRDHQSLSVNEVVGNGYDYLVEKPTGSGKTVEIVAVAAALAPAGVKVLVATPRLDIEQGFTERDYTELRDAALGAIPCPPEALRAARDGDGSVKTIREFLAAPPAGYALACTHAALVMAWLSDAEPALPGGLAGATLVLDEAHRMPAAGMAQVVELWRRRGGRVLLYTATAFRHDGDPVLLGPHPATGEPMRVRRRTLAQHMEEGFAPAEVVTELVAVRTAVISAEEFRGSRPPTKPEVRGQVVVEMVARWIGDGRPKLIVRVPVMPGGSGEMVEAAVLAFRAAGARVLDLSGQEAEDKDRFLSALPAERHAAAFHESKWDVLVGVQRVSEGTDWPFCSTVYCVGLPASLTLVTQLLGRATRDKRQAGYPPAHARRAKIVFFVPCGEPSSELVAHHRRSTVLVCAHLENSTAAAEWAVVKAIGRGLVEALTDKAPPLGAVAAAYPAVDPGLRAEAVAVFAAVRADLLAGGSPAADVDVLERAYAHLPQIPRAVLRQVMVEYIVAETGEATARGRERVRRALLAELAKARETATDLKAALRAAFEKVVISLDSVAVCRADAAVARVHTNVITLTGQSIREIGFRLADARPLTPEWLGAVVAEHHALTGSLPSARTPGHAPGWPDETWAKIDRDISQRRRGWPLPAVISLQSFVQRYNMRGAVGALLEQFRKAARLVPAEHALLDALKAQRVEVGGHVCAFAHTPVPALSGWPHPQWWVLAEWWRAGWDAPLAALYAAHLLVNLRAWLADRGHAIGNPVDGPTWAAVEQSYAGAELLMAPPADQWVDRAGVVFSPGREFVVRVAGGCLLQGNGLARKDGARPFTRRDAGFAEATVQATPHLTAAGNPSSLPPERLGAVSAFPLTWVRAVNGQPAADWAVVRAKAGVTLTRKEAA